MGMGDITVDMRLNMAAESTAKLVYENLMKFTDDVLVKETLRFLMTREVTHFQMFEAAPESVQPNFPPGILQSDPKLSNKFFNMSKKEKIFSVRGMKEKLQNWVRIGNRSTTLISMLLTPRV